MTRGWHSPSDGLLILQCMGEDRPLCDCHGEPMSRDRKRWRCRVQARDRRLANRERNRETQRQRYLANRERNRETQRQWYLANRERKLETQRQWRLANLNSRREYDREYDKRRVRLFGQKIVMPDTEFAEFARKLRDKRKAESREAA